MTARRLLLAAALVLAGCGGDDPPAPAPVAAKRPAAPADRPACEILRESDVARMVLRTSGRRLEDVGRTVVERTDTDDRSSCGYFAGPHDDVAVKLVIDRAPNAQQQFWYRVQELNQRSDNWSGPDPRLVRGVGQDDTYGGAGAFWTPSMSKLAAYRQGRMLTVVFFVPGVGDRASSAAAAGLARTVFRRLFGPGPVPPAGRLTDRQPRP